MMPARKLWVELETRILSQQLHYRSGDEETAAKSVSSLFDTVRKLLVDHPQAIAFEALSKTMLNQVIRPYTARWHGWITQGRFNEERTRRTFRAELQELQNRLEPFGSAFKTLSDGKELDQPVEEFLRKNGPDPRRSTTANLGTPIVPGIGEQVMFSGSPATVGDINAAEHADIRARRILLGTSSSDDPDAPLQNATGLALSGGGIRSATFCLGIVQVLARRGYFTQFDYLSTVSGGGYFGSFLSCYLGTAREAVAAPPDGKTATVPPPDAQDVDRRIKDAFGWRGSRESDAARHLRNNSKYLLNGGFWGRLLIVGLLMSGVLFNVLMLLPIPLGAALLATLVGDHGFWGNWSLGNHNWFERESPAVEALVGFGSLAAFFVFFVPLVGAITKGAPPFSLGARLRGRWESAALLVSAVTALSALICALPMLLDGYVALHELSTVKFGSVSWDQVGLWLSGAAAFGFGPAALKIKKTGWLKKLMMGLFLVSGPLFFLLIFLFVTTRLMTDDASLQWSFFGVAAVFVISFVRGWLFIDLNTLAPHRFYSFRLCECFLAMRGRSHAESATTTDDQDNRIGTLQRVPLSALGTTGATPYHLINCTLNLPSSTDRNLRGRNGDFFFFSRRYCGSPIVGYAPTPDIEAKDGHLDLGTAMAISGAAASSNMGIKSMPAFRFIITLMNIRLGYWLRRPDAPKVPWFLEGVGPFYLFRELAGRMDEHCRYLNLSDGGHIENLAVYELLRRRCKFIVCVDGGADPTMGCEDLLTLQRYAAIDLGVHIELDLADLRRDTDGLARAHSILAKVVYDYSSDRVPTTVGWLLYIKLAVTGAEPDYVRDYRRVHRDFPHETTGDQLFEEDQFEAYRVLGETAIKSLLRDELVKGKPHGTLEEWFQCLADRLLPDNDPAFNQ
ncbi:MAG TPA: hypothetical protein PLX89_15170 [Verrucomicrobiota bacterium]|nr:hypothetical protein [Verrucomicrobiota bacterium]